MEIKKNEREKLRGVAISPDRRGEKEEFPRPGRAEMENEEGWGTGKGRLVG